MNKKKNINRWGIVLWLFLLYLWTYIFVVNTTDNASVRNYTYINKVLAKLNFFQDQTKKTTYSWSKNDLYNWKWSSPNYPLQAIYNTWLIIKTNVSTSPSILTWSTTSSTTIIPRPRPPRRHSH